MTRPRRKPTLDVYGRERPPIPPLFIPEPGQLDIFGADIPLAAPPAPPPPPPATEPTSAPTEDF